jgi:hypothetical protein
MLNSETCLSCEYLYCFIHPTVGPDLVDCRHPNEVGQDVLDRSHPVTWCPCWTPKEVNRASTWPSARVS